MKLVKSIVTSKSVTVVIEDKGVQVKYTVKNTDDRFTVVKRYIENNNPESISSLFNTYKKVEEITEGKIKKGVNGTLMIEDDEMPPELATKIKQLAMSDYDPTPFVKFWQRLKKNPSENSRRQLYLFIENCNCNITADGQFIVYKGVNTDLRSLHHSTHRTKAGQTIDLVHTPGTEIEIPRDEANDNPSQDCSFGLHCAPWCYVNRYYGSNHKVELLVDPAFVVSVPRKDLGEKMRVCKYRILRAMKGGDEPRQDILATMKKKETVGAKKARASVAGLKKLPIEVSDDIMVIPPDLFLASGMEVRDQLKIYLLDGNAIIGKLKDTEALDRNVAKGAGKFKGTKAMSIKLNDRGSLPIEMVLMNKVHEGKSYLGYTAEIITLNKRKLIKLVPDPAQENLRKKEFEKEVSARKATRKLQKKTAKKAAKKTTKKAAKKTAKKTSK